MTVDEEVSIKNFKENDPVPDVFGRYQIGHEIKMPDGRRFKRGMFGDWKEIP